MGSEGFTKAICSRGSTKKYYLGLICKHKLKLNSEEAARLAFGDFSDPNARGWRIIEQVLDVFGFRGIRNQLWTPDQVRGDNFPAG